MKFLELYQKCLTLGHYQDRLNDWVLEFDDFDTDTGLDFYVDFNICFKRDVIKEVLDNQGMDYALIQRLDPELIEGVEIYLNKAEIGMLEGSENVSLVSKAKLNDWRYYNTERNRSTISTPFRLQIGDSYIFDMSDEKVVTRIEAEDEYVALDVYIEFLKARIGSPVLSSSEVEELRILFLAENL